MNWLGKILEKLVKESKQSREWRTFVFCLAAVVVFTTTYSLILPAITVETNSTDSVGGLVMEEADPGSTGAGVEASDDVVTVEAENEPSDKAESSVAPEENDAVTASAPTSAKGASVQTQSVYEETNDQEEVEEYRQPYNGEVQTYGDRRFMYFTGDEFDVMVSGDLSVDVPDGTILSVRGISDQNVAKSYSDRISEELLKLYVDRKTTEVLYQLVFTDKDQYEYTPTGYFDVEFYFHRNTVDHSKDLVYAAIYNYLTDEMILAEKNGDVYETPVIYLDEYGAISSINLKGINFNEISDIITLVAGPVNEKLKLEAEKAAAGTESEPTSEKEDEESGSDKDKTTDSKAESGSDKDKTTDSKTESGSDKDKTTDSKTESGSDKDKTTDSKTESGSEKDKTTDSKTESGSDKDKAADSKTKYESGTLTARGSDYTVTLAYGADAKIPDSAVLEVKEIANGTSEYNKYLEQAKAAMGLDKDQVLPKEQARFFDIRIMSDGKEVQPAANVNVSIAYDTPVVEADPGADAQIDASAVHFGKEGAEVVEVADADTRSVEFEAESFSVYGVIYTVDFEYTDPITGQIYTFKLNGGESINLTDLLVTLGIKSAEEVEQFVAEEVENVEFSDPELVKVTRQGKVLGLFGSEDWLLESLKPFNTEETLTISLKNGGKIVVKVTDAIDLNHNNTQLTAFQSANTDVTYDPNEEVYKANFTMKFVVPKQDIDNEPDHALEFKLGPDIKIPDSALNNTYTAIDHGEGLYSFDYRFVKKDDGYYIEIVYRQEYLLHVEEIGKNTLSFDALIAKTVQSDEENLHVEFTDEITIDIPKNQIQYPENEDEQHDIHVDKSYIGYGATLGLDGTTFVEYTVTVNSNKGTNGPVVIQDTLSNLMYKVNGQDVRDEDNKTIEVRDVEIMPPSPQGTLTKSGNSFTYTLPQLGANGSYTVKYRYILSQKLQETGEEGATFKMEASGNNSVTASSGGLTTSDGDNFKIEKSNNPVTINKTGKYDNDGKIEWKIIVELKNGNHTLVDDMFKDAIDLRVHPQGGVHVTASENKIVFDHPGTYEITYKTNAPAIEFSDQTIKNTAIVDDNPEWKAEIGVNVPHSGNGNLNKSLQDVLVAESDGSNATYILTWNVTFDLPENGLPAGTVLKDTLWFNKDPGRLKYDVHEFTEEQKNELVSKIEAIFGPGSVDVNLVADAYNYELVMTLKQDWTNPEHQRSANISYSSTAYVDLDNINFGLSDQVGKDSYNNKFTIGDVSAEAKYTFRQETTKIDESNRAGASVTEHTVTKTENMLKWAIVMDLSDNYSTMTITDTLPAGLTIQEIYIGGEYDSNKYERSNGFSTPINHWNDYMKGNVQSIIVDEQAGRPTSIAVNLAVTDGNRSEYFTNGAKLWVFVHATVDEDQFDTVSQTTVSYTNHVSVTGDGEPLGEDDQTQNTTLDAESIAKTVINTNNNWRDFHEIEYVVDLNKDGHAIMVDDDGQSVPGATYTVDDVLQYNKTSPDGKEITVMLVPNSVKLYTKSGNDWVLYEDDWAYQFIESKDGDTRFKTISVSEIPDQTPIQLRYTYKIDLADTEPNKQYNLGDLKNTATIHGSHDYSIEHHTSKNWEEFDTTASSESSHSLTLSKVDLENYNKLLPGAKFVLEKWKGREWVICEAISQEAAFLTTDTIKGQSHQVYVTAENPSNRRYGTIKIYQPYFDTYTGPKFETNTCYRIREYSAPDGYILSDDPDKQPAGYFWFSDGTKTREEVEWPDSRIQRLSDDLTLESDTFYITNAKHASLKISKKFLGDFALTEEQKNSMTFEVYDPLGTLVGQLTYADILANRNIIKDGIQDDTTYTVIERVVDVSGAEHVTTYSVNGEEDEEADAEGDPEAEVPVENGIGTVTFTNIYETPKTSIKVTKEWYDASGQPAADPEIKTIKFQVYQLAEGEAEGTLYIPEGQSESPVYEIHYSNGQWEEILVDKLPKYADPILKTGEYRYYVVETEPSSGFKTAYKCGEGEEGEAVDAAAKDDTQTVVIVNREATISVTKKFVNEYGEEVIPDENTSINFKIYGKTAYGNPELTSGSITYANGEWSTFNYKLPTTKDNNPILSYSVEETSPTNYAVSYLVNGEPISDDNPITSGADQTVTIVNAERVPEGEIHVKKVWEGAEESEKQPVNIELWAVKDDSGSGSGPVNVYVVSSHYFTTWEEAQRDIISQVTVPAGGIVMLNNNNPWNAVNYQLKYLGDNNALINGDSGSVASNSSKIISGITRDMIIDVHGGWGDYVTVSEYTPPDIDTSVKYREETISSATGWTAKFENLPYGYTYYIKETNAPAGFKVFYSYTDTEGNTYSGETAQEGSMTGTIQGGAVVTN